jgi:hypothetical protein
VYDVRTRPRDISTTRVLGVKEQLAILVLISFNIQSWLFTRITGYKKKVHPDLEAPLPVETRRREYDWIHDMSRDRGPYIKESRRATRQFALPKP